jgi:glycine reductase
LVPVDVMRDLEKEGVIGKLHEKFYSTAGAVCVVENIRKMGQAIAKELKEEGVSGVILTST